MDARPSALHGRCDCDAVTITLERRPERINPCACDYCRRAGARWGYVDGAEVRIEGATVPYRRAARAIEFRRCELCGVLTHWQWPGRPVDRSVGINMANMEPDALAGIPVAAHP